MPGMPEGSEGPYRLPGTTNPEGVADEEVFAANHTPIAEPEPIDTTGDLEAVKKRLGIKE